MSTRLLAAAIVLFNLHHVLAHCDTPEGPVIPAARKALESGDLSPALRWIKAEHEPRIKADFAKALSVRAGGAAAREVADAWFVETFVRLHRAGEGEPYTGIKPAGTPISPAVKAGDAAIESGAEEALVKLVTDAVAAAIRQRFAAAREARAHADHNVDAGRAYVAAYVSFVHFVERLHALATAPVAVHHHHE